MTLLPLMLLAACGPPAQGKDSVPAEETGGGEDSPPPDHTGITDMDLDDAEAVIDAPTTQTAADSLSGGMDATGDGVPDVLVLGEEENGHVSYGGAMYLLAGPLAGTVPVTDAQASFYGAEEYACSLGCVASFAGDLDGNGYADVVLGILQAEPGGAAYVFSGPFSGSVDTTQADAVLLGEEASDAAGASVAPAGDVDDDGFDDLLVGAPWDTAGWAYLVHGPITGERGLETAEASFRGVGTGEQAGAIVASAGDANGDGFDDVLIGTGDYDGLAYFVAGPASGTYDLWDADGRLLGGYIEAVASAGDVDGDGRDDLLAGSITNDESGESNSGAAFLVYGAPEGDRDMTTADATLLGEHEQGFAGFTVAGAGDTDADGRADMLIGSPYSYDWEGVAYLVVGPVAGTHSLGESEVRFASGRFGTTGRSLSTAGDTDADGRDDLLIGAPLDSTAWLVLAGSWE